MRWLAALAVLSVLAAVGVTGSSAAVGAARSSVFTGYGFDACSAPPLESMQAWTASPYRALGIYIGGANRACANVNLTPAWLGSVEALGFSFLPLYVGLQAPCVAQKNLALISAPSAQAQGVAAANDAVAARARSACSPARRSTTTWRATRRRTRRARRRCRRS